MLKPKVTNEHSIWHENCNQTLTAILEHWINSNHNMECVSRRLVRNLKERGLCLTLCRLEDKLSLGSEKERQLSGLIRRKERPAKLATLVERYKQLLDEMYKIDDQKPKDLKPDVNERMRSWQKQRQTTGLGKVNIWMAHIQEL